MKDKAFYVIEVNKGSGPTAVYLSCNQKHVETHCGLNVTSNIYMCIKFYDKDSAELAFRNFGFTLKDWMVTEHIFQPDGKEN